MEMHLCEKCAHKLEELDFSFEPQFSLQNLFGGLLNDNLFSTREAMATAKLQCPNCALTFAQFSQIGRLGCSACFITFGEKLQPLLRRIHGGNSHTGKVPGRAGNDVKVRRKLEQLKEELQKEIKLENFEQAATLRDRIRAMENELKKGEAR